MRIYKFKDKRTNREAFYGNIKLLLKQEAIFNQGKPVSYWTLYRALRLYQSYETETIKVTETKLLKQNVK